MPARTEIVWSPTARCKRRHWLAVQLRRAARLLALLQRINDASEMAESRLDAELPRLAGAGA